MNTSPLTSSPQEAALLKGINGVLAALVVALVVDSTAAVRYADVNNAKDEKEFRSVSDPQR